MTELGPLRLESNDDRSYQALFELNPNPLYVVDLENHRFLAVNAAAIRQYGYSQAEFLGLTAGDLRPEEERARLTARLEEVKRSGPQVGLVKYGLWKHRRKDGSVFEANITAVRVEFGKRDAMLAMSQDVSVMRAEDEARRERERQQHLGQKMDAIGRLAGGVAHEFNNILTGIMGLAALIQDTAPAGSATDSDAGSIIAASKRAAGLVLRLLTFSRQKQPDKRPLDLNELVGRNRQMASAVMGERVRLELALCEEALPVNADPEQLDQILLNLCLNARDAIDTQGTVVVSTRAAELKEELSLPHGSLAPGRYAVLSIRDSGHGISSEHQERIFEPFFTTRSAGRGMGLGLSVAYSIAREHDGAIGFEAAQGGGTLFRIYLPLSKEPVPAAKVVPQSPARAAAPGSRGTILVADDEAIVRDAVARILAPCGYRLLLAADGEEAVRLFSENPESVQLLLLDVIMPRVDGVEAYERMKQLRPSLPPVVFMSGYATAKARELIKRSGAEFLPKPFMPSDLLGRIERVLDPA